MPQVRPSRPRPRWTSVAAVVAAVIFLGVHTPAVASAHAALSQANPADGARVTELPATVSLTFNEDIQPQFAALAVTSPDEQTHSGTLTVAGNTLSAPLRPLPAAGTYTVAFRAVSSDGHPITGSYDFTYSPPPSAGQQFTQQQTATPPATAPRADDSHLIEGADNHWFWMVGILVVAILAGGAALVHLARSHSKNHPRH